MTARAARLSQPRHRRATAAAAIVAMAAAVVAGCAAAGPAARHDTDAATASGPVPVGECVVLHGDGRADALRAAVDGCDGVMSYTVAAHTDIYGDCPPPDGYLFVEPFADRLTARLCLVPNLVVGQCYTFGVPSGIYDPTSCAGEGAADIRIEERFEVSDAGACTDPRPSRATVYRAVPRTYCLSYPGIDE